MFAHICFQKTHNTRNTQRRAGALVETTASCVYSHSINIETTTATTRQQLCVLLGAENTRWAKPWTLQSKGQTLDAAV